MKLSGAQLEQVINALTSGYDSESELEMMVRIKLDLNLNIVVEGENLRETTFELVTWAEEHGRLDELIKGAQEFNAGNLDLQKLIDDYQVWRAQNLEPKPEPKRAPAPQRSTTADPTSTNPTSSNSTATNSTSINPTAAKPEPTPQQRSNRLGIPIVLASVALVLLAGLWWLFGSGPEAATVDQPINEPNATVETAPTVAQATAPQTVAAPTISPTPTVQPVEVAEDADIDAVRATIDQEVTLGNQRNLDGVISLLAPNVHIVDRSRTLDDASDDRVFNGHDGARQFYGGFFDLDWNSYTLHDVRVEVNGDSATATHHGVISDGQHYGDVATYLLTRGENGWKITSIEVGTTAP